jgi:hypothetical protein
MRYASVMSERDDLVGVVQGGRSRTRAPKTVGRRTTLRVPESLDRAAGELAAAVGTTRNDALVLLAEAGAKELARTRARLERSRELVARYEAEEGVIPDDLLAEVDRLWPA